jgi:hypothetical protein
LSEHTWSTWEIDEILAPTPTTIFAPNNAATALRTLRELGNRNWNAWFLSDGTQQGDDLLARSAYNSYFLGYDVSDLGYEYTRRMQMLLFAAATDTWRTDLADPLVRADLGDPTYTPGPWTPIYDVATAATVRTDPTTHPDEVTRFTTAIVAKSPAATTGRTLLVAVVDGSDSFHANSGMAAWQADALDVPGVFAALKSAADALVALGRSVDVLVIKCSGWDSQEYADLYNFDGGVLQVGGDGHRYGDDEDDFEDPTPTLIEAIPALIVHEEIDSTLDLATVRANWFTYPTEADNGSNDMAETILEGIRHGIGYSTVFGSPVLYESKHVIVATDAVIKFPVDQYFDGYPWPDLPIVTESFGPIDIPIELTGTLSIDMTIEIEGSVDVDMELSGWLIPIFQEPIEGAL